MGSLANEGLLEATRNDTRMAHALPARRVVR